MRKFRAREDRRTDLKGLRAAIDSLEVEFATELHASRQRGDHLAEGSATMVSRGPGLRWAA